MGALVSTDALILSRAAIVGPFDSNALRVGWPGFDRPANLKRWADGPRVAAVLSEVLEGLSYEADDADNLFDKVCRTIDIAPPRRDGHCPVCRDFET